MLELFRVAEIELFYRSKVKANDCPKICQSIDAFEVLFNSWDQNKIGFVEQAKVMVLNRANRAIGICDLSSGSTTAALVEPKLVFITAIKKNASSIVLAHNHPSCNLTPSKQDEVLTQRIEEAGKLLEIRLLDHLIISQEGYYSFMDQEAYSSEYLLQKFPERAFPTLKNH